MTTLKPWIVAGGLTLALAATVAAQTGWQIPATGKEEKSPLQSTPEIVAKGKGLYLQHCEGCHGPEGKGDGPDGDSDAKPADLSDAARAGLNPDGVLFYKVWNGRRIPKMPAMKDKLQKDDVWALVEYVKTLRK